MGVTSICQVGVGLEAFDIVRNLCDKKTKFQFAMPFNLEWMTAAMVEVRYLSIYRLYYRFLFPPATVVDSTIR